MFESSFEGLSHLESFQSHDIFSPQPFQSLNVTLMKLLTSTTPSAVLPVSHTLAKRVNSRTEAVPQFFLNFLRQQTKMRRWSRKSMMGGRGCFGMKMDRIGSMSGLGC
uniref:C-type natriuretic peptide 4 n=1 Tax=Pundamilia nyererei TaxID=303518 RepID=A0A3B4FU03_9CICH